MTQEADLDRLTDEGVHAERMLLVSAGMVQVGEGAQSCQHRTRRVQDLNPQSIESGARGGLSGVDMQPEGQSRRGGSRGNANGLCCGVCVRCSVTILPCIPTSGVGWLGRIVVQHSRRERPRSGGACFESRIADQLLCGSSNGQRYAQIGRASCRERV